MRRFVPLLLLAVVIGLFWVWWAEQKGLVVRTEKPPDGTPAPIEPPRLEGTAGSAPDEAAGEKARASVEDPDRVSLRILDARTGLPIAGAVVDVHDVQEEAGLYRSSLSGADGRLSLPHYEDWGARWFVRRSGYVFLEREVWGGSEPEEVRLEPAPALAGRVVDARTGRGLGGARVLSTWADAPTPADREQVTDPEGRFDIAAVPPDRRVDLIVALDGYATVRCRSDGLPTLEIPLGVGAEVRGRIVDGTGGPVPDARVYVADRGAHSPLFDYVYKTALDQLWPSRALTSAAGRFSLRGVDAPSEVIVYATDLAGSLGKSEVLRVASADTRVEVEVTIEEVGSVEISFRQARTKREVKLRGACSLAAEDMPPEYWWRIEVLPGEALRVSVDLERGRTVTGRLVDGAGSPLRALVSFDGIWRGARQTAWADADPEGRFTLEGIPPAAGTLSAWHYHFGDHSWPAGALEGEVGDLVFPEPPSLLGRVPADLAGTPVLLGDAFGRAVGKIQVKEGGRFEIKGLVPNRPVTYYLRPKGGAALVLPAFVLAPGEVRDVGLLAFPDPVTIAGRLLDARGLPVPGALVRTIERWCKECTRTDLEGRFRPSSLPPGRSTLYLETAPATVASRPIPTRARLDSRGRLDLALYPGRYTVRPHEHTGFETSDVPTPFEIASGEVVETEIRVRRVP